MGRVEKIFPEEGTVGVQNNQGPEQRVSPGLMC